MIDDTGKLTPAGRQQLTALLFAGTSAAQVFPHLLEQAIRETWGQQAEWARETLRQRRADEREASAAGSGAVNVT